MAIYIAILHTTKEIIGAGNTLTECWAQADATLQARGVTRETHDYFTTSSTSRNFWGGWYAPNFWHGQKKGQRNK